MKVILDTNVLVSGLLSPYSPPGEIVRLLVAGRIKPCVDARIVSEYADVLSRPKFKFAPDLVAMFLDFIKHNCVFVACEPLPFDLPDKDDHAFYEAAIAGKAVCLVTGNIKHFQRSSCKKVKVLAPAQFIDLFRKKTG